MRQIPHYHLQIVFTGVRGKSWVGDVAIDDIALIKKWSCGVYPVAANPNPGSAITCSHSPTNSKASTGKY